MKTDTPTINLPAFDFSWRQLPEGVKKLVEARYPFTDRKNQLIFANEIMCAIDKHKDKAFWSGYLAGIRKIINTVEKDRKSAIRYIRDYK